MNLKHKFVVPLLWVVSTLLIAAFALAQTNPASLNNGREKLLGSWNVAVTTLSQVVIQQSLGLSL
jgi:hypothetical protein